MINLSACICAYGTALPPALIYQGRRNELQDSRLDDLSKHDKAYCPNQNKIQLLERAVFLFAVQNEIIAHEKQGLRMAITQKKQRHRRRKCLNPIWEEEDGKAQFFPRQRILAAQAH